MKKEEGFTLVEILVVVVLLGLLLSLMYNVMLHNAFQQKRTKNEMEAQNSAKALLNYIGEVVMECNIPIMIDVNDGAGYIKDSEIYVNSIIFNDENNTTLEKQDNKYVINSSKEYDYIDEVSIVVKDKGLQVTVVGMSDKANAEFSSTFYSRNT